MPSVNPRKCTIVLIDMARDFVEEGGLDYFRTYYAIDNDRQFKTSDQVVADWNQAPLAAAKAWH